MSKKGKKKGAAASDDASGLYVAHTADDFEAGEEYVLTLKDKSIMEQQLEGDDEDELENQHIKAMKKIQKQKDIQKKQKIKSHEEGFAGIYAIDEDEEMKDKRPNNGFFLTHSAEQNQIQQKHTPQQLLQRMQEIEQEAEKHSLTNKLLTGSTAWSSNNEYYTQEEMAGFKKRKDKKQKKDKKKKSTKEQPSNAILDEPEDELAYRDDHRSRADRGRREQEEQKHRDLKDQSFLNALHKAQQKTSKLFEHENNKNGEDESGESKKSSQSGITIATSPVRRRKRVRRDLIEEDDGADGDGDEAKMLSPNHRSRRANSPGQMASPSDIHRRIRESVAASSAQQAKAAYNSEEEEENLLLQESLGRARLLAEKKKQRKFDPAQAIAEAIKQQELEEKERMETGEHKSNSDGSQVVSATTEFCRSLQVEDNDDEDEEEEKEKFETEMETVKVEAVKEERSHTAKPGGIHFELTRTKGNEDEEGEDTLLEKEPLACDGVMGALMVARRRGFLSSKSLYDETQVGRLTDKALRPEDDPAPELQIIHRDDDGNILKPKEAFRHISHKFHGREPGKNKKEKMRKRIEELTKKKLLMATEK